MLNFFVALTRTKISRSKSDLLAKISVGIKIWPTIVYQTIMNAFKLFETNGFVLIETEFRIADAATKF